MVAKYNGINKEEMIKLFEDVGLNSLELDDFIYRQAGLTTTTIGETYKRIAQRHAEKTAYNLASLTRSTIQTSQLYYIDAINKAYLEVSTGYKSYNECLNEILKDVPKGTQVQYMSGAKRSIESAVRTNLITATNQMSGELQLERGQELGNNLYEVSAHIDSRPTHADWQGKVYTKDELATKCGYGQIDGLCGINCRHTFYPYIEGSIRTYTQKELEKMKNATVTYKGNEINTYDATQIQRKLERNIRENKKQIASFKGALQSDNLEDKDRRDIETQLKDENKYLRQNNANLREFLEETGLKESGGRLAI